MKPLLAVEVAEGAAANLEHVTLAAQAGLDGHFGPGRVRLALILNEGQLRAFQAGELVLYAKPVRDRSIMSYTDKQTGTKVALRQQSLFDEGGDS